ncbi:MAG TPA: replicative DNA helicase, partial [Desulfobacterales bacterium]|nr:replicative DNA helicase [Desulfobacterales bacterium]
MGEAPFMKVAPNNIEAEQAVLGGILINNEAINQILDILRPEDFYKDLVRGKLDHVYEVIMMRNIVPK